jgi:hypothetical protein
VLELDLRGSAPASRTSSGYLGPVSLRSRRGQTVRAIDEDAGARGVTGKGGSRSAAGLADGHQAEDGDHAGDLVAPPQGHDRP